MTRWIALGMVLALQGAVSAADTPIDFTRDVRPILFEPLLELSRPFGRFTRSQFETRPARGSNFKTRQRKDRDHSGQSHAE